ncbi:hypothetical protein GGR40_000972 [Novosphingobium gossypii]
MPKRRGAACAELDYRQFALVSQQLTASYARLSAMGMPQHAVATAMLGATVNLYECFGMTAELPAVLRALADRLEQSGVPLS